jgi:hypothetical protein
MGVTRDVFYDSRQIAILPMGLCFPARVNPVTFRHGLNARGHDTINSSIICAILKLRWLLGSMHRHIK